MKKSSICLSSEGEPTTEAPSVVRLSDFPKPTQYGPVLPLLDMHGELDTYAGYILFVTMVEPHDESKRHELLTVLKAELVERMAKEFIDRSEAISREDPTATLPLLGGPNNKFYVGANGIPLQELLPTLARAVLGPQYVSTLLHAPSLTDVKSFLSESATKGHLAGLMLLSGFQAWANGKPTGVKRMSLAVEQLLESAPNPIGGLKNARRLEDVWKNYMPVAHYWAMLIWNLGLLWRLPSPPSMDPVDIISADIRMFLGCAEIFARFGTTYAPSGARKPLMNPSAMLHCTPALSNDLDFSLTRPVLEEKMKSILDTYRAPKYF